MNSQRTAISGLLVALSPGSTANLVVRRRFPPISLKLPYWVTISPVRTTPHLGTWSCDAGCRGSRTSNWDSYDGVELCAEFKGSQDAHIISRSSSLSDIGHHRFQPPPLLVFDVASRLPR